MLYGIAIIVIAALIGLVVFNLRGSKPAKEAARPAAETPKRAEAPAPEKPAAQRAEAGSAPAAERAAPARPAAERAAPAEPPRRAAAEVVRNAGDRAAAEQASRSRAAEAETALPPRARRSGTTSLNWEQSDEEYRKALRGFVGDADRPGDKNGEHAEPPGKDDAYREGLRSLSKSD
ncbi:hypothetical protein [Paenibacillus hamazuiensis]|uniref:hypothetical protein n=1 Tax=Paenibacillus hamazuiensis TaxID=2936508 RepID=UPI00200D981E|nr:hypothetical protein [Paenibacillus hamazuiensis]